MQPIKVWALWFFCRHQTMWNKSTIYGRSFGTVYRVPYCINKYLLFSLLGEQNFKKISMVFRLIRESRTMLVNKLKSGEEFKLWVLGVPPRGRHDRDIWKMTQNNYFTSFLTYRRLLPAKCQNILTSIQGVQIMWFGNIEALKWKHLDLHDNPNCLNSNS